MVMITSTPALATPAGESAALAPASTNAATACAKGSKTVRLWPALSRLRAIGPPMLPRPRNPICMMATFCVCGGEGIYRNVAPPRWVAKRPQSRQLGLFERSRGLLRSPSGDESPRHRSFEGDSGVHRANVVVLVEPALGDRLGLGVEGHHLLAVRAQVAELGGARTGEGEQRDRYRDRHVDAHLANVDFLLEVTGRRAGAGEQGGTVAIRVGVDDLDRLAQAGGLHDAQHRAEDFFAVHGHLRSDVGEDGRADEVAVLVARHARVAAIQFEFGAFFDATGDQAVDAIQGSAGNDRADVGARFGAAIDLEGFGPLDQVRQPGLRFTYQNHYRQGHAALASGAEGSAQQVVQGLLLVGIGQDDGVVLRAHHALCAFAVLRGAVVDVSADLGRTHEGHGLDVRMITNQVHRIDAAVDDVEYALGYTGLQRQFDEAHGHEWVLLGRLEDEGVAGGDGHREHPQWDHRREVERGDAGAHAQRLHQGVGVDAVGAVAGQLAPLQVTDGGGVLDHFQAAEHITFGIRQGLALFGGEQGGQFLDVLADQLLVFEEDPRAGADRGLAPGLEGFLGAGHGGIHFFGGGEWHTSEDFLGGRVDHVTPLGTARFDELAVDEELDAWNAG